MNKKYIGRKIERQADGKSDRKKHRQNVLLTNRRASYQLNRHTYYIYQMVGQMKGQTSRQIEVQTDRWTDRWSDKLADIQMDRWIDRQTYRQTDILTDST